MSIANRITLLGVPIDLINSDNLGMLFQEGAENDSVKQIVLLSFMDFMKARWNSEKRHMLREARLVVPTSMALVRGIRFLERQTPEMVVPFNFVIRLLGELERVGGSLYILGEHGRQLNVATGNLRDSFPGLTIVGRHTGFIPIEREQDVILAIKKAAPTILLVGDGIKNRDRWVFRRRKKLGAKYSIWCGDCFRIFEGKGGRKSGRSGGGFQVLINPVKLILMITYGILLLFGRIKKS